MNITAIILTLDEANHLPRCLESVRNIGASALVVDSFSEDDTVRIAKSHGAKVLQHTFLNHGSQFNWALSQLDETVDWVLRIDADEIITPLLAAEIREQLPRMDPAITGVYCGRRMTFQGTLIRYGGIFPIRVLRLFRNGCGESEHRWMDEHINVVGQTANFKGEILDDNLNSLSWWVTKHNGYASREAVDLLNLKYRFMPNDRVVRLSTASQAGVKRWIKEKIYAQMPGGLRAFVYFFYRYILRFGFLDGSSGTAFHVLQGFWYRYLVDAKIAEVERYLVKHKCGPVAAIEKILDIKLNSDIA